MVTETTDWAGMWRDIVSNAANVAEHKLDKLIDKFNARELASLYNKVYKHRYVSYEEFCKYNDIEWNAFVNYVYNLDKTKSPPMSLTNSKKYDHADISAKIRNFLKGIHVQYLYFIDLAAIVDGIGPTDIQDNADMVALSAIVNLPSKLRTTHHFVLFGVNKLFSEIGFTIDNSVSNKPSWVTYCAEKCTDTLLAMQIGHYGALSSTIKYTIVGNFMTAAATARLYNIDCSVITHRNLLNLLTVN